MSIEAQHHPFYPRTLRLPDYVPNTRSTFQLLLTVGLVMCAVVSIALAIIGARKQRSLGQRARFVWFTVSAILHLGFESYWIYRGHAVASRSDLLSELWKEYAHGDSRYLSVDPVLLAVETITVVCIWDIACTFYFATFTCMYIYEHRLFGAHFAYWRLSVYGAIRPRNTSGSSSHPWHICLAAPYTLFWIFPLVLKIVIRTHCIFGCTL